jgi:hypothetical protein
VISGYVPLETLHGLRDYPAMTATAPTTGTTKEARIEVTARVRHFFARLRDEFDQDSEDFFNRVMEQASRGDRALHKAERVGFRPGTP